MTMTTSKDRSQIPAAEKDIGKNRAGCISALGSRIFGFGLLLLAAVPLIAGTVAKPILDDDAAQIPKLSSAKYSLDLRNLRADANDLVTITIQYRQMPSSTSFQAMQERGGSIQVAHPSIRAITVRVPASMLAELASDPNIAYITPDRTVRATGSTPENEEFATAVEADIAASQFALDGTGIGVAVIDSGIADHADLHNSKGVSRVVYSQSFVAGDSSTPDRYGHGTHVAGLIGGTGISSGPGNGYAATYAGMAPNVNLINLRVLDKNGNGTDSQVIAALQQAIALKRAYNIRVINMSLGRIPYENYTLDPVCQAVEAAWKAGIVVVVSAGNYGRVNYYGIDGFGTIGVPGNDPAVITVGATRTVDTASRVDDTIASYSSKGPTLFDHVAKPDLVAPGNRIVSLRVPGSTMDIEYPQFEVAPSKGSAQYFRLSGTSMSTPIVAGAVALMLQQNSGLTPDQVKARLMKTAWKGFGQYSHSSDSNGNMYANEYDVFTYGAGYLDIDAALKNSDVASGVALSPSVAYNSKKGTVSLTNTSSAGFAGSSVVWGSTSLVWGNSVVWGSNTILTNSVVWGATSVVWGANSMSGFSVVWGATSAPVIPFAPLSAGDDGDN